MLKYGLNDGRHCWLSVSRKARDTFGNMGQEKINTHLHVSYIGEYAHF